MLPVVDRLNVASLAEHNEAPHPPLMMDHTQPDFKHSSGLQAQVVECANLRAEDLNFGLLGEM